MFDEINLAVKRDANAPRKEQIARIKLISFICLFIVAVASIVIFFINLHYSTSGIKKEQTQAMQSLSPYNDTVAKIYLVNARLTDISNILTNRRSYSNDLSPIMNLVSENMGVVSYQLDSQQVVTLVLSSSSLSDINTFLNKTLKLSSDGVVGDVKLTALKTDDKGYILGLQIQLL